VGKKPEKLWQEIQQSHNNVRFKDFCRLIEWFGFVRKGGKGSHQTYYSPQIREIMDIQPMGGQAKPYQIKQLTRLVKLYDLKGGVK
jgi:predicted RNA binding protein YcfA (HicA-like mRNA interferase family)